MGFFDKLAAKVKEGVAGARRIQTQFTDAAYLDAAIAVGFLVGGADGDFDADEREGLVNLIKSDPTLRAFDDDAISASYGRVEDLFKITMALGRKKALALLSEISKPDQKQGLMEFAAVISTLDGEVGDDEVAMVTKIADALGENVADYKDLMEV